MDADGLALDDGAGTYVHEDGGNTNRLSIIDDELQTRDDSIDINKTKRNHILGTALKIALIVLTVCIYTGGPMLNSWATRIPGWQWNFSLVANTNTETETGIDLINYDETFDGKRNFVHYAHKASNCEWISTIFILLQFYFKTKFRNVSKHQSHFTTAVMNPNPNARSHGAVKFRIVAGPMPC